MARKLNGRSISIHRSYLVKDIADALGVHKGSVLRWIRRGELTPNDAGKPILVHGRTIRAFLEQRRPKKQNCALNEWFCIKCRSPRHAAFHEGEIVHANGKSCNVRALCSVCATVMHKRVSLSKLADLAATVRLSAKEYFRHLIE